MPGPTSPPTDNRKRLLLGQHPLLRHLKPPELDALVAYARVEKWAAGKTVFLKGDPGTGLMAVMSGRVRISAPSAEGKEIVLNIIEPGEVFGEIALLDGGERTADAVASENTELLVLDRRDFVPFLERHPEISVRLLAVLCARLRRTSEQVEDLLFLDLPARLAKTLLRLADEHGRKAAGGIEIAMTLSQSELANMVGMTRESVNKQLREWQKAGILASGRGPITVRNGVALADVAGGSL